MTHLVQINGELADQLGSCRMATLANTIANLCHGEVVVVPGEHSKFHGDKAFRGKPDEHLDGYLGALADLNLAASNGELNR